MSCQAREIVSDAAGYHRSRVYTALDTQVY